MRKGTALGLAGIVAASLVAGIALLGGRVATAGASAPAEPQVVTEHRRITVYKTETLAPETIVVQVEDEQGEDESEEVEAAEAAQASASPTPSPTATPSPSSTGSGYVDDGHDAGSPDLGDGLGGGHDD